jgi:hypothetical protein
MGYRLQVIGYRLQIVDSTFDVLGSGCRGEDAGSGV